MNSWRRSSVMCPTAVRNSMARSHSSSVSRISRMNACRCRVSACISSFSRGSRRAGERRHHLLDQGLLTRRLLGRDLPHRGVRVARARLRNDGLGIMVTHQRLLGDRADRSSANSSRRVSSRTCSVQASSMRGASPAWPRPRRRSTFVQPHLTGQRDELIDPPQVATALEEGREEHVEHRQLAAMGLGVVEQLVGAERAGVLDSSSKEW